MTDQPQPRQNRHLSPSERQRAQGASPLEPLERILDKGIVIDAWAEVRVLGIPLASLEARVIVASIETYLYYAQEIMEMPPIARGPMAGPRAMGSTASRAFAEEGLNPVIHQLAGGANSQSNELQPADAPPPAMMAAQQNRQLQQRIADLERREAEVAQREAMLPNDDTDEEETEPEPAPPPRPRRRAANGNGNNG